jgi:hypothetical protein
VAVFLYGELERLTVVLLQTKVPTIGSYFFDEVPVKSSKRISSISIED